MIRRFRSRYKEHRGSGFAGYIYMMYFMYIIRDNSKIYISGNILPIFDRTDGCMFSLVFPTGLVNIGNQIIVTCVMAI